tara:strand:- start:53 stop:346 length:294 start_codon:yes stop_codon:yes gene_type:complete
MIELKNVREVQDYCDMAVRHYRDKGECPKGRYKFITLECFMNDLQITLWYGEPQYYIDIWAENRVVDYQELDNIPTMDFIVYDDVDFSECIFEVNND